MSRGWFVTGTDTGVGKTLVTSALARRLVHLSRSVGVMKPVETGVSADAAAGDAARLRDAARSTEPLDVICPCRFTAPLAPHSAARLEQRTIDLDDLISRTIALHARHDILLVEGAGGLLVPMGADWTLRDLIVRLGLPVVIVGRAGLGGVNHALLTLEGLKQVGVRVAALVLNETSPATTDWERQQIDSTYELLRARAGVPIMGPLPYQARLDEDRPADLDGLSRHPVISRLVECLLQTGG